MDLELNGTIAVVTGASAGIGTGIAEALAAEGALTVLVARREDKLTAFADRMTDAGHRRPVLFPGDVTQPDFADSLRSFLDAEYGRLDILVNSAGGSRPVPLDASDEEWDEAHGLNFTAGRRLAQAMLELLRASGRGRIINVTGTSEPHGLSAATSAKAGVHAWSKAMSTALGRDGVTVNCIVPGVVLSEQIETRHFPFPDARDDFADKNVPVGRFGNPSDLGNLAAFLASSRGEYITGEIIHVDGGLRKYAF